VLHEVLDDVETMRPPALVAESVVASYLRDLYLDPDETETRVTILHTEHSAADYETWLKTHESQLPNGTFLITGLASFIHYGAHIDGFRLQWFQQPLSPGWKLVREYETLTYLPKPEPARIWRLDKAEAPREVVHDEREDVSPLQGIDDPAALLRGGMARYDKGDNAGSRPWFKKLMGVNDPEAENGAFFYAASFFRAGDYMRARHEFKRLVRRFPTSRWVPSAYWHLATCEKALGRMVRARDLFASIVRRFPNDPATVAMAKRDLKTFERRREGVIAKWWRGV
jgi:tetratricopeptide (TPR) repeat protein